MDQDDRIERLKEEARRLSGGKMQSFGIDQLPRDMAEQFLKRVIAFETGPTTTNFDQLTAAGVVLPPPAEVADADIGVVLWRVIFALAKLRTFLDSTNHLSDRELYAVLWDNVLREEITVMPEDDTGAWHVSVPGDDEHSTNYLKYYATEKAREGWCQDIPGVTLPAREQPAYDRDCDLPVADDRHPHQEALAWLRDKGDAHAFATNRFDTTADAVRFVEQLYDAGASCVMVDQIRQLDRGEPYADELIVVFPRDARRSRVFELIEEEGRPDTLDDNERILDNGRESVRLWWD